MLKMSLKNIWKVLVFLILLLLIPYCCSVFVSQFLLSCTTYDYVLMKEQGYNKAKNKYMHVI